MVFVQQRMNTVLDVMRIVVIHVNIHIMIQQQNNVNYQLKKLNIVVSIQMQIHVKLVMKENQ